MRVVDEQEDAADVVERGDGAAGHDDEAGLELGDGNEAEVGVAGVELARAVGRGGVVEGVVGAERRGGGRVLEVIEQRSRVEEGDGCDAEGHGSILLGFRREGGSPDDALGGIGEWKKVAVGCEGLAQAEE